MKKQAINAGIIFSLTFSWVTSAKTVLTPLDTHYYELLPSELTCPTPTEIMGGDSYWNDISNPRDNRHYFHTNELSRHNQYFFSIDKDEVSSLGNAPIWKEVQLRKMGDGNIAAYVLNCRYSVPTSPNAPDIAVSSSPVAYVNAANFDRRDYQYWKEATQNYDSYQRCSESINACSLQKAADKEEQTEDVNEVSCPTSDDLVKEIKETNNKYQLSTSITTQRAGKTFFWKLKDPSAGENIELNDVKFNKVSVEIVTSASKYKGHIHHTTYACGYGGVSDPKLTYVLEIRYRGNPLSTKYKNYWSGNICTNGTKSSTENCAISRSGGPR